MIVLDASVILKWFFRGEPDTETALRYRQEHIAGDNIIVAPELLVYEVTNALAVKAGLGRAEAEARIREFCGYEIETTMLTFHDLIRTARLAQDYAISAYDATYLALAQHLRCPCVTADEHLWRKTHRDHDLLLLSRLPRT